MDTIRKRLAWVSHLIHHHFIWFLLGCYVLAARFPAGGLAIRNTSLGSFGPLPEERAFSLPVLMMIKESVKRAYEAPLSEGLLFERRSFHSAFALEDRAEGMTAFVAKRAPEFKHR